MPAPDAKAAPSTTNPREKRLPRHQLRLVAAAPETNAGRSGSDVPALAGESFAQCAPELAPLFVRFWREAKRAEELDPDWQALLRMDAFGQLVLLTARADDVLVGFALSALQERHLFYRVKAASTIAYWLDPAFRAGMFAVRMFRRNLELLKERGAQKAYIAADLHYLDGRAGKLFERLGYELHETHYAKVL